MNFMNQELALMLEASLLEEGLTDLANQNTFDSETVSAELTKKYQL